MKRLNDNARRKLSALVAILILTIVFSGAARAQVASNPPYAIQQAVIAGGGGTSADAGNTFSITGTIGQAVTGASGALPYRVQSGFFTITPAAPTAGEATLGGVVRTADGRGIRKVLITLTDGNGQTRTTLTTAFGYFRFENVRVGETYVVSVRARRFEFALKSQVVSLTEDDTSIEFVAY